MMVTLRSSCVTIISTYSDLTRAVLSDGAREQIESESVRLDVGQSILDAIDVEKTNREKYTVSNSFTNWLKKCVLLTIPIFP